MSLNDIARQTILATAHNAATERLVGRYGMRLGASRFVAGETLDECVVALRGLNEKGFKVNTTLLGEAVNSHDDALRAVREYEIVLRRLAAERLDANVALKLTHLGLDVGEAVAQKNLVTLLELARGLGLFIRIDMEESRHVDSTLAIYGRLRERGFENVGTVLQAYLYRSESDLEALLPLRPNLRLVKGAYLESREVAFPKKKDVDQNYLKLLESALTAGGHTAVATHDDAAIEHVIAFASARGIDRDRFEFQMLYGVRPQLQRDLVGRGYRVLVATPFGSHWYPYLMRRLAERPANVLFLVRNLVRR